MILSEKFAARVKFRKAGLQEVSVPTPVTDILQETHQLHTPGQDQSHLFDNVVCSQTPSA